MSLRLTPDILRAAYEYLDLTSPFARLNLPDSEDVLFRITNNQSTAGLWDYSNGRHIIKASRRCISTTPKLFKIIGHEMIHVHEYEIGISRDIKHSGVFVKLYSEFARVHGFDPLDY